MPGTCCDSTSPVDTGYLRPVTAVCCTDTQKEKHTILQRWEKLGESNTLLRELPSFEEKYNTKICVKFKLQWKTNKIDKNNLINEWIDKYSMVYL